MNIRHRLNLEVLAWFLLGALLFLLSSIGCAMRERPIAIWHRNTPEGWTVPKKFSHCVPNGEVVMENGKPNGRDTVRLDCLKDEETVYVDSHTKQVVWREHWWGAQ